MFDSIRSCSCVRTLLILSASHVLVAMAAEAVVDANFTFSPANPMAGQQVQFTDTSTGGPTNWQWDFENPPNGTDSTLQNPTWTFDSPGTYPVKLTAFIPPADIDDKIINIIVGPAGPPGNPSFTSSTYQVNESASSASIAVRRTGGSTGEVSVRCDTSNGTATAGSDYTATMQTLNWGDGDTANKICTVSIIDDANNESNETVNLALTNVSGTTLGSPNTAVLTIIDDDPTGNLSFISSSFSVDEPDGPALITVRRTGGSAGAASVRCNTSDGTATAGMDYIETMETLNWGNGDISNKTCSVGIINDPDDEPAQETVNLTLTNFSGAAPGSPITATLTINDDDEVLPAGVLSFTSMDYEVSEASNPAMIVVQRTAGSEGVASVVCETSDGTATAGDDYIATMQTLNWGDGDTTNKICNVPIIDDSEEEGSESVNLALTNVSGATLGTPDAATLTITDDDEAGALSFTAANFNVAEDVGTALVTVSRASGMDGVVSVQCSTTTGGTATAGSDYQPTMLQTLTWTDQDTDDKNCEVDILDDMQEEGDETINLSLTNPTGEAELGARTTTTLTILANDDVDPGELSFTSSSYQVNESDNTAAIAVRRTAGSDGEVRVRCDTSDGTATAGSDYTTTMDVLIWGDGDTANKLCTIPITPDMSDESNETINLSLTNVVGATLGAPSTAVLTIIDDDNPGVLSFTSTTYDVNEDVGPASITVQRTGGSVGAISVRCDTAAGGTAIAGSDYTATMETLEWSDGDTADKTCSIPIINDTDAEPSETVNLSLSNETGGATIGSPDIGILTIHDDADAGSLSFTMEDFDVDEDTAEAVITVQRTGASDGEVTVDCNSLIIGSTATADVDYTTTMDELTWTDGVLGNQECTVPILDDTDAEGNETVNLLLADPTGFATIVSPSRVTLTIIDDENIGGELSFTMMEYEVDEAASNASITVQRTGGSVGDVSVDCATADGSATAPDDYTETVQTLEWMDGDSIDKTCTVPVIDDAVVEGDETVLLSLASVVGAALGDQDTASLTILDDDDTIFRDEFESGDTCDWSAEVPGPQVCVSRSLGDVLLRVPDNGSTECGAVQLAPAEATGSVRLGLSANGKLHLELVREGIVVLEADVSTRTDRVLEILDLNLASYELEIMSEDGPAIHYSIELTASAPCASFEIKR